MEEKTNTIKKLSKLSKEDIEEFLIGYRSVLAGIAEFLEGVGILKKIEDEKEIPVLQDNFFDVLSELIESDEFKEAFKKTDSEHILLFFRMIFNMIGLIRKLEGLDPKRMPYKDILDLSNDLKKFVKNLDDILEEMKKA